MAAPGRGCVKTQNPKSQVGITLYISWFQSLMWGFYTQIGGWMTHFLGAVPKTMTAK